MNDIDNKFLLAGDKFMPEMHVKQQPVFTYSTCGLFTKNKQRIQKFTETGNINDMQHDMAYNFKDLKGRTFADKVLKPIISQAI